MKPQKIIILSVTLIILAIIGSGLISYLLKEYEIKVDEQKQQTIYSKILDGTSIKPTELAINYSKQISTSSPLIFGGAETPLSNHQDAWNKIADAGITMIRRDFFIEQTLPTNFTLEDYKKNKNNIQNPSNWNQGMISDLKNRYKQAHIRGIKTMGIVDYAPAWLTYSGTQYGLPKDWAVYEDLVKKTYTLYRGDLDYLEIWNEPTYSHFIDTKNSNKSMDEIYIEIAEHTIKAIREVDVQKNDGKLIPLGGLVADNPIYAGETLKKILQDSQIKNELAFISYHAYGYPEPSNTLYREILKENGLTDMPMFLTEWNYSSDEKTQDPYKIGDKAIVYVANQFLSFIKESLTGANYYMLEPIGYNQPGIGIKYMGFYRWINNSAELLPQAKTWRLLSNKMGLGRGKSTIYQVTQEDKYLNTLGFINVIGQKGITIVNDSSTPEMTTIKLNHTGIKQYAKVDIYYASSDNDSQIPAYEGLVKVKNGALNLMIYVPQEAVVGMTLTAENEWFDIFNLNH